MLGSAGARMVAFKCSHNIYYVTSEPIGQVSVVTGATDVSQLGQASRLSKRPVDLAPEAHAIRCPWSSRLPAAYG